MGVVLSSQRSPSPRVVPDTPTRSRCRRHPILSPGALQSWISPLIAFTLCSTTSIPRAVSPSPSRPRPHTTASSAVHCDECATRPPRVYRSRPPIYCWRRTGVVNPISAQPAPNSTSFLHNGELPIMNLSIIYMRPSIQELPTRRRGPLSNLPVATAGPTSHMRFRTPSHAWS